MLFALMGTTPERIERLPEPARTAFMTELARILERGPSNEGAGGLRALVRRYGLDRDPPVHHSLGGSTDPAEVGAGRRRQRNERKRRRRAR